MHGIINKQQLTICKHPCNNHAGQRTRLTAQHVSLSQMYLVAACCAYSLRCAVFPNAAVLVMHSLYSSLPRPMVVGPHHRAYPRGFRANGLLSSQSCRPLVFKKVLFQPGGSESAFTPPPALQQQQHSGEHATCCILQQTVNKAHAQMEAANPICPVQQCMHWH